MSEKMQEIHIYFKDTDVVRMARFLERTGTFARFCGHGFDERGTYMKMSVNDCPKTENKSLDIEYVLRHEMVKMVTVV